MTFSQVQGNADVKAALTGMVDSGRIPHAIMFHEEDGGSGIQMALSFLQYLYCSSRTGGDSCGVCPSCNKIAKLIHPDVHFVYPTASGSTSLQYVKEWRELVRTCPNFTETAFRDALGLAEKPVMIAVSEANSLLQTLSLSALEGGYRSVVIYLPELMNQESANKLLKVIEEPPALTQFLLITHSPEKVLPTIASRCQRIRIKPDGGVKTAAGDAEEEYSRLALQLLRQTLSGNLSAALETGDELAALPTRESAKAFCRYFSDTLRHIFLLQQGLPALAGEDPLAQEILPLCSKTFPRRAEELLDRAQMLIGRNVNLKIIFTDLVDRLYSIK